MLATELIEIVRTVQAIQAETQTIEVKSAAKGCPNRLYDTLSAFSNQDDGGTIVFGLDESRNFEVVGVYDAQDLQKWVTEQCCQMEPVVRPLFTVASLDGAVVVSAEIPPANLADRPCFYKGKGRERGSYCRVGESDSPMTDYEIYSYNAFREKHRDDIRPLHGQAVSDLDQSRLADYLQRLKASKSHLASLLDAEILALMGFCKDGEATLAAELIAGLYPQAHAPQLAVVATAVPGIEMGDVSSSGERFIDSRRIEGTLPEMLAGCLAFVQANMRVSTTIDPTTAQRKDVPEYPLVAVREAVLNALIHRDYGVYTEGMPVRLTMYSDRMEIISPGGLYGRTRIDRLGVDQPDTRNPTIATAMEVIGLAENRYSGIPTIRKEMSRAGLPDAQFEDGRTCFRVVLQNGRRVTEDASSPAPAETSQSVNRNAVDAVHPLLTQDVAAFLVEFCKVPRSRNEIADELGVRSVSYAVSRYVKPLVDAGRLKLTKPDAPRSKNQRYVSAEV